MNVIERKEVIVNYSHGEMLTLSDFNNLIANIAKSYKDNETLINPDTGECVEISELSRFRGILDFFVGSTYPLRFNVENYSKAND